MFRELIRKNKEISRDECLSVLVKEKRGVLSVLGDESYPYGMPMNHYYNEEDGCIYFHCGRMGHRLDSVTRCDKVSFCVVEKGVREEGDWAYTVRSVIVFGRAVVVDDRGSVEKICEALSLKFTSDREYIAKEIGDYASATLLLKLTPEHICGKRVKES